MQTQQAMRVAGSAAVILMLAAPAAAQASDGPVGTTLSAAVNAGSFQPAGVGDGSMRSALAWAWANAGAQNQDGYGRFKMDIIGEVGLEYLSGLFESRGHSANLSPQPGGAGSPMMWRPSLLAEFSYMRADFGSSIGVGTGLRLSNKTNERYGYFGQFKIGLEHDEFENALTFAPGGGVIFFLPGRPFALVAGFDYGFVRYEGFTSKGPGFYGGIGIPIGGR